MTEDEFYQTLKEIARGRVFFLLDKKGGGRCIRTGAGGKELCPLTLVAWHLLPDRRKEIDLEASIYWGVELGLDPYFNLHLNVAINGLRDGGEGPWNKLRVRLWQSITTANAA